MFGRRKGEYRSVILVYFPDNYLQSYHILHFKAKIFRDSWRLRLKYALACYEEGGNITSTRTHNRIIYIDPTWGIFS